MKMMLTTVRAESLVTGSLKFGAGHLSVISWVECMIAAPRPVQLKQLMLYSIKTMGVLSMHEDPSF